MYLIFKDKFYIINNMGIINETARILNRTARILADGAFIEPGDIYGNMGSRGVFRNGELYNLMMRPIGLYQKSYGFMLGHINRNIGNAAYTFDGYSTPIGELANPFYNTDTIVPWFFQDNYKNSTSNYLDYVRTTYGATLSVENINTNDLFHVSEDATSVGRIDGILTLDALGSGIELVPNPNYTGTDTMLGRDSGYYNQETLKNALTANDKRVSNGNYITKGVETVLGVNTNNIKNEQTYTSQINKKTGRFEDGVFSPLRKVESPVYVSNFSTYRDIGSYEGFLDSLSDKSKNIFYNNVSRKTYNPSIEIKTEKTNEIKQYTYFDKLAITTMGHSMETNVDGLNIRHIFKTLTDHSNVSDAKNGGVYVYTENEYGSSPNITYTSYNSGTKFSRYTSYGTGLTANDLLKKTNESFKNGNYKTIIARFHTDSSEAENTDTTQTAISEKYGLSHGRNLLKTVVDESESYENPYCRVWTFHHQYHRLKDAIRPLDTQYNAENLYGNYNFSAFTADHSKKGFDNGRVRLENFGVINKNNGLVNITPIDNGDVSRKVDIKNCMFSIENLAWKDIFSTDASSRRTFQKGGLSPEQKGPFGGRIMWFPPYDLKFNENVNVNWNETNFIGRGEGIYTYTNTTRNGNLSFKILVDHPSIINYWENRGKSNSNSVDDIDDPEQQLLRFFAGCDMLTAKSGPIYEDVYFPGMEEPVPSSDTNILKFFVFYPNNYSGHDDDVDFAMKYLTNGLGAGKTKNSKGEIVDYQIPYAQACNYFGGYEMRAAAPISIVKVQNETDVKKGNTKIIDVIIGSCDKPNKPKPTSLYIQEGDSTDIWWERKWYYRVDKAYKNQLLKKESYLDTASYCLNSSAGQTKVAEHFGITDTNNLYSFADVYAALEGGEARSVLGNEGLGIKELFSPSKVTDFLNKIQQYGVDHVECIGRASVQGHDMLNDDLQINRARTVKKWLSQSPHFDPNRIKATVGGTGGEGPGINLGDENSIANKLWRCAEVNIYLRASTSKTVQASLKENFLYEGQDGDKVKTHKINTLNTTEQTLSNSENVGVTRTRNFNDMSANKIVEERVTDDKVTSISRNENINDLALNFRNSVKSGSLSDIFSSVKDAFEYIRNYGNEDLAEATNDSRGKSEDDGKITRYDNESKFFTMLEREEPFLHHKISDKIKYFDPAFHSISPEGFNARLTFLQQCTRQGPTIGNSDNYTADNTANNLAFGRPPVCVLRIGDFYYTKILIDSMTIDFDPLVWDLNSEGIGVMPMIANVSINFKFIGGSSLAGHIARLQNALSFNYYANTEVYDDRSELAQYDENGNIERLGTQNLIN